MMNVRDMSHLYRRMREQDLRFMRARKLSRLRSINGQAPTYLNQQEIRKLTYELKLIDVELRAREDQLPLFK